MLLLYWSGALGIVDDLLPGFARFKLGAHFLDLPGLLFELRRELHSLLFEPGCESLYLFLLLHSKHCLLHNRCLQLLNFVIEGLALLGTRGNLRFATVQRCATRRHATHATRSLARAKIKAKVVVCKVQSNLNNGGAVNRLEVVEDTTDVAGCGPEPITRGVGDADRKVLVGDGGPVVVTNELADVSVIEASG